LEARVFVTITWPPPGSIPSQSIVSSYEVFGPFVGDRESATALCEVALDGQEVVNSEEKLSRGKRKSLLTTHVRSEILPQLTHLHDQPGRAMAWQHKQREATDSRFPAVSDAPKGVLSPEPHLNN